MKRALWTILALFGVVLLIVMGVWFFVVDIVIEAAIEKTGTDIIEARVDLESADLSIFPLGLSLSGLQVTNPDAPMTNAVQVDRIALSVEGDKLLRRKVIVKEMIVDGIRLNTPRKSSGAISERSALKSPAKEKFSLPSLEVPNVTEILKKENLRSLALAESLKADFQAKKEQWKQRLAELPDKTKLEAYRKRVDNLKSATKGGLEGLLGGVSEVVTLQKDIRADLDRIKTAKTALGNDLALFRSRMDEVKKAPFEDFQRLKEKYTLSPEGLSNFTRLVLGGKVSKWTDTALVWYERLSPLLEQAKGKRDGREAVKPARKKEADVRLQEGDSLPDFLIRIARVSMEIPAGSIKGRIQNITPGQDVLGVPLTYNFSGEKLKGLRSLKLDGALNHVDPSSPKDTANLKIKGYQIADLRLSDSNDLPLVLKKAGADFNLKAFLAGQALKANLNADLKSVRIASDMKKEVGALSRAISSALSDIEKLSLQADISGTLKDYDIKLSSDLDRVLKNALSKLVKEQAALFGKELNARISEKVSGPLAGLKADQGGLAAISGELTSRLNLGDGLLKDARKSNTKGFKLPGFPW